MFIVYAAALYTEYCMQESVRPIKTNRAQLLYKSLKGALLP